MPKIREYQRQVGTSEGIIQGGVSPEAAAQTGRAVAGFGQSLGEVQERIHQKNVVVQTTESSAKLSELRAEFHNKIKEQADQGEVDYDGLKSEFDDRVQGMMNDVDTDEARNYIIRSGSELKSSIDQTAFAASAELERVRILENHQKRNAADTQVLRLDPTRYQEILNDRENYYSGLKIGAKQLEKMRYEDSRSLNLARISGEIARTRDEFLPELADKVKTGNYDLNSLSGDDINAVLRDIKQEVAAREGEKKIKADADKRERERLAELEMDDFVKKAVNGNITSRDVSNFNYANSGDKMRMISWMRSNKDEANKEDQNKTYTDLYLRIQRPDGDPLRIYSDEQLIKYLDPQNKTGSVSIEQFEKLRSELKGSKSEAGIHRNVLKDNFLNQAKDLILKKDPATGAIDPTRYTVFNSFTEEYKAIYDAAKDQGIKDSELFNEESKANLYYLITKYNKTSSQILRGTYRRDTMQDNEWVDLNGNPIDVSPAGGMSNEEFIKRKKEGTIKLIKKQKAKK